MKVQLAAVLTLFVCLFSSAAAAQNASLGISPSTINYGSVEDFIAIRGSGLIGTGGTLVTFTGPGGTFELEPSLVVGDSYLEVWVPMGVALAEGRYTVAVYALEDAGPRLAGSGFLNIAAVDNPTPPLLSTPEAVYAEADGPRGAVVTYAVGAIDGNGADVPVTCDQPSGSVFPLGTAIVTCSATNAYGTSTNSFPIVVGDTVVPVVTVPADIVTDDPVVMFGATAVDNLDGDLPVTCSPLSGTTFPIGTTVVECVAEDAHLNAGYGRFTVTVTNGVQPPVLTVPADITAEATGPDGAVVSFEATATNDGTVVCTPASGSTFAIGTTAVNCTATNAGGSDSDSFNVTVADTTPPTILSISATPTTLWPPDHKMIKVRIEVNAFDAADPTPVSRIVGVVSNQPVNGTGDGDMAPDWNVTGALSVDLRAERAGTQDRIYTILVDTTDASGNVVRSTVQVKVTDPSSVRRRAARF
ncbi:MAG TPA: HYR domain-containing protein [Thermoanaerobaculia bacterium]|jgi:hypothetical protein